MATLTPFLLYVSRGRSTVAPISRKFEAFLATVAAGAAASYLEGGLEPDGLHHFAW
jgi:hypothetical protein